mgnify:CR=1 FL=1
MTTYELEPPMVHYTLDSAFQTECDALVKRNVRPQDVIDMAIALELPRIVTHAFPRMPLEIMTKLYTRKARISLGSWNRFSIKERVTS